MIMAAGASDAGLYHAVLFLCACTVTEKVSCWRDASVWDQTAIGSIFPDLCLNLVQAPVRAAEWFWMFVSMFRVENWKCRNLNAGTRGQG